MLKKLFGRKKKGDDDEDEDFDEDFDDEDFDDTDMADGGDDEVADDADAMDGEGEAPAADMDADMDADMGNGMEGETGDAPSEDGDASADEGSADGEDAGMEGEPSGDDGEDIDFGDDEDDGDYDEDDDDDDYDDEDDEDEEEGRFAALWGNTWIKLGIITFAVILFIGGAGIGGWMFISSGVEEEIAKQEELEAQAATSGGGLQPSSQSLNDLSGASEEESQLVPPPTTSNEAVGGEQLAGTAATSGLGTTGGLNAIGAGGGTGGLNALGAGGLNSAAGGGESAPGSVVVVPVSTAASYNQFPDYPLNEALSKAPIPDLLELRDDQLPLPRVAADGRTSWQEYARPSDVPADKRRVALLVSGLGLSRAATLSAISKLPGAVSLSFSPYAEELEQWMIRSRRLGHEVVLGLPLESNRFPVQDAGPLAMMTVLSDGENLERLTTVLSSQQGYIGVEVMMGTKYTADEFRVRDLLTELNQRGLMVIDGAWNNRSFIPRIAAELAMPRVITSVRLDDVMAKAAIDAKLRELDTVVEARGSAIGTTTITPAILERVLAWISSLPGKNVELVPISALTDTQAAAVAEEQ